MPARHGDPSTPSPAPVSLTKEDVWGEFDIATMTLTPGMVVARGLPKVDEYFSQADFDRVTAQLTNVCPVWGDVLPYKSVTVICPVELQDEVEGWLAYVHGADCVSQTKRLENGKVAIRSDYQCW